MVSMVWEYTRRDIPRRWLDAHKRQQKLHLKWRRDLKEIDKRETGKKVSRQDKGKADCFMIEQCGESWCREWRVRTWDSKSNSLNLDSVD